MKVLRAAARARSPWKNGGGETVEIAAHPPGAGLDDFDWRVSLARVAADGPFSAFPGIDRTLAVLSGAGLELAVDGAPPARLTPDGPPFAFPGEARCDARLVGGPATALNLMVRRGNLTGSLRRLAASAPTALDAEGGTLLVFCQRGSLTAGGALLEAGDAVLAPGGFTLAARRAPAAALVAAMRPAWTAPADARRRIARCTKFNS